MYFVNMLPNVVLISSTFQEKCLFRDVKLVWPRCIYPSFLELRGLLGNEKNAGNIFLELSMGIKITPKIFHCLELEIMKRFF